MICPTCSGRCEPQPYRCKCQRDCWVGDPGGYASCLNACDPECDFPKRAGLPSAGYRCDDLNADGYTDCGDDCDSANQDALTDCQSDYEECSVTCEEPGCVTGCLDTLCLCQASARKDLSDCNLDCDMAAIPDWIACSAADVDGDAGCCNVTLATCYQGCEDPFLASMMPVELAYWECQKQTWDDFYDSVQADIDGYCDLSSGPTLLGACEAKHYLDAAPFIKKREICRTSCEKDEINRDTPADRKEAECGGRYHLCNGTALANYESSITGCGDTWYLCNADCNSSYDSGSTGDPSEPFDICVGGCAKAFYDCAESHVEDLADARYKCCTQEHDLVRHGHKWDRCWLDKWKTYWHAAIQAKKTLVDCEVACGADNTPCLVACGTDEYRARSAAEDDFNTALEACIMDKPDCPNCGKDALVDLSRMGYAGISLAVVALGFDGLPELPPMGFPAK